MADAEESPSSLADLEALAGLGNAIETGPDEVTADEQSFDLASLAASTASASSASEAATDDQTLDLSGLAASSSSAPALLGEPDPESARGEAQASVGSARVAAPEARRSFGFVYGMIAGVAVAGVLFLVMREEPPVAILPTGSQGPSAMTGPQRATGPTNSPPPPVDPGAGLASAAVADPMQAPATAEATTATTPSPSTRARPTPNLESPPRSSKIVASTVAETGPADPTMPPRVEPSPTVATAPPAAGAMDSLLDDALGSRKPAKQSKAHAGDDLMGAELPSTPSAADVTKAVQLLLPAIRGCAMGQSGVANTLLVVRGDGAVASAVITGAPYAGAASGRCMEGVLRRARFGRFQQSTFRVQFPLSIRATP